MRYEVIGDNNTIDLVMSDLRRSGGDPYVKSKRRIGRSQQFRAVIIKVDDPVSRKQRQLHLFGDET